MRICAIGEAMLELSGPLGEGAQLGQGWRLAYGGDTLNTALHLARYGFPTAYLTALGADPFSEALRALWAAEGLDCALVLRDPEKATGLYAITTDAAGERRFTYWRGESAARRMFDLALAAPAVLAGAAQADLLFYSLITLAILPPEGRETLFALARRVRRRGGRVAFDGNYRPRLWASREAAIEARDQALAACDLGLPTLEDEIALAGAHSAEAVAQTWRDLGCGEVVVKMGAKGALGPDGRLRPPPRALVPVDTSGAGDGFNAGYLSVWLRGGTADGAVAEGARLAAWVIRRQGALPARDAGFTYGRPMGPAPSREDGGGSSQDETFP
jgi:2-dehydro-3-deoxygluconokinase